MTKQAAKEIADALGDSYKVVDLSGSPTVRKDPVWQCKIGILGNLKLPPGSDFPMRRAVERAFFEVTGVHAEFIFSGWGGELSEEERKVVKL